MWPPSTRAVYCFGLLHGSQLPPDSSLHSNDAFQSSEEKPNEAAVDATVPEGPVAASVVSGAVVSAVHVRVAGLWSTFPAVSIERTEKVCGPSENPL